MKERYIRNIPALSEEECKVLRNKRIAVIGCGGLGGYIIEYMSRLGVGAIKAVDGDVFDESNLNRQLLSKNSSIGISKAEAAKIRISDINPDVEFDAVPAFMTEENAASFISGCDAVFDALDNIGARRILAAACKEKGIPYIYGAVGEWVAQAAVSMPDDDLIDMLYPEGAVVKSRSVLGFTAAFCASLQVSLCVRLLTGRKVDTGRMYYFDLLNLEYETIDMA